MEYDFKFGCEINAEIYSTSHEIKWDEILKKNALSNNIFVC